MGNRSPRDVLKAWPLPDVSGLLVVTPYTRIQCGQASGGARASICTGCLPTPPHTPGDNSSVGLGRFGNHRDATR
jgi:hypothetical protein